MSGEAGLEGDPSDRGEFHFSDRDPWGLFALVLCTALTSSDQSAFGRIISPSSRMTTG